MSMVQKWKHWAQNLRLQTIALSCAYKDPMTPWYAKLWGVLVVAYAFSPIDLIPDFIPILGYLDDLILIPLGIALAVKLVPRGYHGQVRAGGTSSIGKQTTRQLGGRWRHHSNLGHPPRLGGVCRLPRIDEGSFLDLNFGLE